MNFTVTIDKPISKKYLKKAGFKVGEYASDLLEKLEWNVNGEFDLEVKTVAELGLKDGGTLKEIYAKAKEQGLELCPGEIGPAYRLAYKDQPQGEWLRIAMEPIAVSGGSLRVFGVGADSDDRWLDSSYGRPDSSWGGDDRWVFVRPRNVSLSSDSLDPSAGSLTLSPLTAAENLKKGDKVKVVGDKVVKVKVCSECHREV